MVPLQGLKDPSLLSPGVHLRTVGPKEVGHEDEFYIGIKELACIWCAYKAQESGNLK